MEQAKDFLIDSDTLAAVLEGRSEAEWNKPTQLKNWTSNDVIVHLHFWNKAADLALQDEGAFNAMAQKAMGGMMERGLRAVENETVTERGPELLAAWQELYRDMAVRWGSVDPKVRLPWVGPTMSARSCISARQMETWAHGHEVFDVFGLEREEKDTIKNVVMIGVNTYGWSFKVNGIEQDAPMPFLKLTSPSGEIWEFGEDTTDNRISGSAVEFASVVAQTRNIADTQLTVEGPIATHWMSIAQCFAGPPHPPPAPGTRFVQKS